MSKTKARIMRILKSGEIIRVADGRYTNGFVDRDALKELIEKDAVEKFTDDGFSFVRLKSSPTPRRKGK